METNKKQTVSLTDGPITKSILIFAIPIFIGNIFQQFYNVVDTAIIGNVLGDNKLAAVGASESLYGLVIGLANGFTNGFSVILARYYGSRNEKKLKDAVAQTYVLTLALAVILTTISVVFLRPILVLLNTPKGIIDTTEEYLKIILLFAVVTMFYNMFAAVLRAVGDSRTPLVFLIISSVINVILDIVFVKYLGLGVAGAAYATVIAQGISVVLCIIYIWKKCPNLRFEFGDYKFNADLMRELFFMGFSMGLMLVVVSIGSVGLQSAVNTLGEDIIAAHTAARKIDVMCMVPLGTLTTAAATFASQNYGAQHYDRIYKGISNSIFVAFAWSAIAITGVLLFGDQMVKALTSTSNKTIIGQAYRYLRINLVFFPILSILLVLRSSLQGLGRKLIPVLGSTVELILKFGAVGVVTKYLGYFGVCIIEPIIWGISMVMVLTDFLLLRGKLKAESLRDTV